MSSTIRGGYAEGLPEQRANFSIEFWIKPDTVRPSAPQAILDLGSYTQFSFFFGTLVELNTDGHLVLTGHGGFDDFFADSGFAFPAAGRWYHVAISTPANEYGLGVDTFYVDGQPTSGTGYGPIVMGGTTSGYPPNALVVGGPGYESPEIPPVADRFSGELDELAYYLHPLSADRAAAHFQAAGTGTGGPQLTLSLAGSVTLSVSGWTYYPNPFTVTATVLNGGQAAAHSVQLGVSAPVGLSPAPIGAQSVGDLAPGASGSATWTISVAPQYQDGAIPYTIVATSADATSASVVGSIFVPAVRPKYVAVGDSITTGFSIAACTKEDRVAYPWGCVGNDPPAVPYPDRVATQKRYGYSDNAGVYAQYAPKPGFPRLDLDRVGTWGYTVAEAGQAYDNPIYQAGSWLPQLRAVERAQYLVTGGLGINDLHFSDLAFWAKLHLQDEVQCLKTPPNCGTSMQDTATAMLNAPSVQHGFDRMFQALSTASITNGAQVAVVLYYDPVSTAAGCVDARAIAETLINTVDAELLRRAQAAGLPTVDLRPVFSGHEMGTANAYVFGTTCDLADGALVHLPNWLPSITALKSQFDPHPNSTGTAAMADAILGTVGP